MQKISSVASKKMAMREIGLFRVDLKEVNKTSHQMVVRDGSSKTLKNMEKSINHLIVAKRFFVVPVKVSGGRIQNF